MRSASLFVSQVITRMKEKHPSMGWVVGDMTQLQAVFKGREGTFSAIVDKVRCTGSSKSFSSDFFPPPLVLLHVVCLFRIKFKYL